MIPGKRSKDFYLSPLLPVTLTGPFPRGPVFMGDMSKFLGADRILSKPFSAEDFLSAVNDCLA